MKPSVIDDTTPIHGYTVYYKPEFSTWESVQVPASTRSYLLEGLWCGSRYQIYASAYNKYVEVGYLCLVCFNQECSDAILVKF